MKEIFSLLSLLFAGTVVMANKCDSIISHGLRNIAVTKGSDASVATKYHNHCHKDFSKLDDKTMASLEVEVIGYGDGSGSFNRSKSSENLVEWCKKNQEVAVRDTKLYQESQVIYQGAVEAWSNCLKLNSDGVEIEPFISPDSRTASIRIRYTGAATGGVKYYGTGAEGFSCETKYPNRDQEGSDDKRTAVLGPQAIIVSCKRNAPVLATINNQQYEKLERATITVETASHPLLLYFAEEFNPSLPDQRATVLDKRIELLSKQLDTISSSFSNAVVAFATDECPTGWVQYKEAYGKFIRGIDNSGNKLDPDGKRPVGSSQEDALQSHQHSRKYHQANSAGNRPHANFEYQSDNGNTTFQTTEIVGARVSSETRPKNVALLYCRKK